jgi:hypothetical protein
MMLTFLENWTIQIDKLPKYEKFRKPFTVNFDKKLSNLLVSGINSKITKTMITNFKTHVLKNIDDNDKLTVTHNDRYELGRFYSNNDNSPCCHSKFIKHTVFAYQNWLDIDMVKGHSSILLNIGLSNGELLPTISDVVNNFDNKWKEIAEYYNKKCGVELDEDNIKYYFNMTIYGGGYSTWLAKLADEEDSKKFGYPVKIIPVNIAIHPFMDRFKKECLKLSKLIYTNNPDIARKVAADKPEEYEKQCCVMSYFCGIIENHIVYFIYNYLVKNGGILPNQCLLELDGICLPKLDGVDYDGLIDSINNLLNPVSIRFKIKPYGKFVLNDIIEMRKEMDESEETEDGERVEEEEEISEDLDSFQIMAKDFEKNHIKIINKAFYMKQTDEEVITMNEPKLKVAYGHMSYDETFTKGKKEIVKKQSFIKKWVSHENSNIRRADDVGIYPNISKCPSNIYNIWRPFICEKYQNSDYVKNDEALKLILNHIFILCGKQQDAYEYVLLWIAHMIQFPGEKSEKMITFVSKQGSGKGTLVRLATKMLGNHKVFQTSSPSRDVWGSFNSIMATAFFVNIDELSKKDTVEADGKIKGLITEPSLTINAKGQDAYVIRSYHRFLITTNNEDTIITEEGDRRNFIMRSSDEKKGDVEYFKQMYKYLDDESVIRTCYDYFKTLKGADKFTELKIPTTEFQDNLKEKNRPIPEQWLEDFVRRHYDEKEMELLGSEIYRDFTNWASSNGVRFETSALKLGLYLSNCKIGGIEKGGHTRNGKTRKFNIEKIKKYFNIGCLVEFIEEYVEDENLTVEIN